MTIKYQRLALKNQETIELKKSTYLDILKEFGTFYAYLKTMIHEPFIITME